MKNALAYSLEGGNVLTAVINKHTVGKNVTQDLV